MQVKEAPLGKARAKPYCGSLVYARTTRILLHMPLRGWADSASYPHLRGEVLVITIGFKSEKHSATRRSKALPPRPLRSQIFQPASSQDHY